jgi:C4-dicarboxylate-specific signal transduction histidine kinase
LIFRSGSTLVGIWVASLSMGTTHSINEIRTAIRELSARAELARKEGRPEDATELERRIAGYRDQLAERP